MVVRLLAKYLPSSLVVLKARILLPLKHSYILLCSLLPPLPSLPSPPSSSCLPLPSPPLPHLPSSPLIFPTSSLSLSFIHCSPERVSSCAKLCGSKHPRVGHNMMTYDVTMVTTNGSLKCH